MAVPDWVEALVESWDGCMYDAPGETIDIGSSIRRAALAAPQAQDVQIPEPAFYADDRGYEVSAEWLASDQATSDYRAVYIDPRYTEHQVRQILAAAPQPPEAKP